MPQMMPLNWILLFFLFNCIFMFFQIMNYYNYFPYNTPSKIYFHPKKNIYNWKW